MMNSNKLSMRIIAAMAAAAVSASAVYPVYAVTENNSAEHSVGSASEKSDAIHIASADDFLEFASSCVMDSSSLNKTYILDCDINLTGLDFEPVPVFSGTFDGNGHSISGLKIKENGSTQGLFRYIGRQGFVKNLTVNGKVTPGGSSEKCGGIAGENQGRIYNCKFSGIVDGIKNCGGIAGFNSETGLISSCTSEGFVQADNFSGGIAGSNSGVMLSCTNNSHVNTSVTEDDTLSLQNISVDDFTSPEQAVDMTDIGGITGFSDGSVQNCVNSGIVGYQHAGYNVGGIVGRQKGYIAGCENNGTVYGRKDIGGICGQAEPFITLEFSDNSMENLRDQLNDLSDVLDRTLDDVDEHSSVLSDDTENVIDAMDSARSSADSFLDLSDDLINSNVDSANELSARVSDLVDRITPAADKITDAADKLSNSFGLMKDSIDLLNEAMDDADAGFDELSDLCDNMSTAVDKLQKASNALGNSLDSLQNGLGDPETVQDAIDKMSSSLSDLSDALNDISDSADSTLKNLNKDITDAEMGSDAYLDQIIDALRSISKNADELADRTDSSSSALKDLSDRINNRNNDDDSDDDTDDTEQTIKDILNGFGGFRKDHTSVDNDSDSDSLLGSSETNEDIFSALSDMADSLADLINSYSDLLVGNQLKRYTDKLAQDISDVADPSSDILDSASVISGELDTVSLDDMVEFLKKANENAGDSSDYIQKVITAIDNSWDYFDSAGENALAASTAASEAVDGIKDSTSDISDSFDIITDTLDYFSEKDKITFYGTNDEITSARNNLSDVLEDLTDLCSVLNGTSGDTVDILTDDLKEVNEKATDAYNTLFDILKDMNDKTSDIENYTEDISAYDTEGRSDGKIADCVNYGEVNGDVSVGGIAGTMAIDYDFDPEGDIPTTGERSLNFLYQTKVVTRDCINLGKVTSKKDGAGGIAGTIEMGCIISCQGYGNVSSTDGGYVGGIVGNSDSSIFSSYAMCRLSGDDHIGGIAGISKDMENCRSYVLIEEGDEYMGMIAGESTGDMTDNIFADSSYETGKRSAGAVDGVSYDGDAYPMRYSDFIQLDGMPSEFSHLKLTFTVDGKTVGTVDFEYNTALNEDDIPEIPASAGSYAQWEEFDHSQLLFNDEIEAEYLDNITSIESDEKRESGFAVLLAEGQFGGSDKLELSPADGSAPETCEEWNVTIPDDGQEEHTLRYLSCIDDPEKVVITVTENGTERTITPETDGKYVVFTVSGNDISFKAEKGSHLMSFILIGIAAAAAVIIVITILLKIRKKKKNGGSKKSDKTETKKNKKEPVKV